MVFALHRRVKIIQMFVTVKLEVYMSLRAQCAMWSLES